MTSAAASGSPWRIVELAEDFDGGCRVERPGGLLDVVDSTASLGGAARLLGMLGRDERDGLAEVADVLHGQDGLVGELEAVALVARDVLVREDGVDAGHAARAFVSMR